MGEYADLAVERFINSFSGINKRKEAPKIKTAHKRKAEKKARRVTRRGTR